MSINLQNQLLLPRCPRCKVAQPNLFKVHELTTSDGNGQNQRFWRLYKCQTCGGLVMAWATGWNEIANEIAPEAKRVESTIPEPANAYLRQAYDSLHAPSGAVMLAGSAVDAMLISIGHGDKKKSLYVRIDAAKDAGAITDSMANWAHHVRLGSNKPRHVDENAPMASESDAEQSVKFAHALATYLFVLPAMIPEQMREAPETNGEDGTENETD